MFEDKEQLELTISRSLDAELSADLEHELNRTLIREPEWMRLRDDYRRIDRFAEEALGTVRKGDVDLGAIFAADQTPIRLTGHVRRSWMLVPGAIAAALLAMVIPRPDFRGQPTQSPVVIDGRDLYPVDSAGGWNGESFRTPVSTSAPRVRSRTGRDVIGVVGDDGNLYWIEVEKTRTVRWPGGRPQPDPKDSF